MKDFLKEVNVTPFLSIFISKKCSNKNSTHHQSRDCQFQNAVRIILKLHNPRNHHQFIHKSSNYARNVINLFELSSTAISSANKTPKIYRVDLRSTRQTYISCTPGGWRKIGVDVLLREHETRMHDPWGMSARSDKNVRWSRHGPPAVHQSCPWGTWGSPSHFDYVGIRVGFHV